MVCDSVIDAVGASPPVRLPRIEATEGVAPLGSIKDRIGVTLIEAAERQGGITPGRAAPADPTA